MTAVTCLSCREPIVTRTFYGQGGTKWIHEDGYMECRPTYASPNFHEFATDGSE